MGYSKIPSFNHPDWMILLKERVKNNTYQNLLKVCMLQGFAHLYVYMHNDIKIPQHLPESKGDIWMHVKTTGPIIGADNMIPSESLVISVRFVKII